MTPTQRKDYIANSLLKKGVNKTSIIAILCNGYEESARTFSPTIGAFNGDGGFGIWQFTNQPDQMAIINYARTHSEKEAIDYQVNKLLRNNPVQWYPARGYTMSWNDFIHNTGNWSWQYLTKAFVWCWERPNAYYAHVDMRLGAYNNIMPINWDGNAPDGGNGNGEPKNNKDKKGFKFADCRSLLNKNKPNKTDTQKTDGGGNGGVSQGFNPKPCLDFFNSKIGKIHYSLSGLRVQIRNGSYGDCSSFVSHMLELGYNTHNSLPNTEGLHSYLIGLGYKLIYEGRNTGHIPDNCKPAKTGDVIIQGRKGSSSGAGGHTGICLQAPAFYDCDYYYNGLHKYASEDAFLAWNSAGTYYYLYRK